MKEVITKMNSKVKKEKASKKYQNQMRESFKDKGYSQTEIDNIMDTLGEANLLAGDGFIKQGWVFEGTLGTARRSRLYFDTLNIDGKKVSKDSFEGRKTTAFDLMQDEWDERTIPIFEELQKKYMVRRQK